MGSLKIKDNKGEVDGFLGIKLPMLFIESTLALFTIFMYNYFLNLYCFTTTTITDKKFNYNK